MNLIHGGKACSTNLMDWSRKSPTFATGFMLQKPYLRRNNMRRPRISTVPCTVPNRTIPRFVVISLPYTLPTVDYRLVSFSRASTID
jgi:hypothetical protein